MTRFPLKAAVAAIALMAAGAASAATVPAVDLLNTPALVVGSPTFVVGYRFGVLSDVQVTALGAYDYRLDGFNGRADVGLYTLTGELLASVGMDGAEGYLVDQFRYADLAAPVRLTGGTEYVLGSWSNDPNSFFNANYAAAGGGRVQLATDSRIELLRNRDLPLVTALTFPSREPSNTHLGSFGPNMLIEDVAIAPVPVPAGGVLLLTGIAAFAATRRKRR